MIMRGCSAPRFRKVYRNLTRPQLCGAGRKELEYTHHMIRALLTVALLLTTPPISAVRSSSSQAAVRSIITEVRNLIARDEFASAEKTLRQFIAANGATPDALEALSWLGRGAL